MRSRHSSRPSRSCVYLLKLACGFYYWHAFGTVCMQHKNRIASYLATCCVFVSTTLHLNIMRINAIVCWFPISLDF
jgi:hypothetical protein